MWCLRMIHPSNENKLTLWSRSLALLFLQGLSLGMAVWLFAHNRVVLLKPYINGNQMPSPLRSQLLVFMVAGGLLWVMISVLRVLRGGQAKEKHLETWALRFAPLAASGFIPLIFFWKIWVDQELTFLLLVGILGLWIPRLIEISLGTFSNQPWSCLDFVSELLKSHRLTKSLPLTLVLAGVIFYTLFFSYFTILAHHGLRTADYDMGIENNLMWNLTFKWLAGDPHTPLFKTTPFAGPNGSTLGWHTTFIAFLLTPFYALYPDSETLLVLQSLLIALTALPLFLWAKLYLNEWLAALLAMLYLLFSPVHGSNLYDFHWLNLGPVFVMTMFYFLEAKKDFRGALFILLTLAVREDVAPAVSIVGTYFLLSGRRPRLGFGMALLGVVYFVYIKLVFMPHVAGHSAFIDAFKGLLPPGETTFTSVMKTVMGNPGFTLTTLLEKQKIIYLLHFLSPLVFMPFYTGWTVLFLLPGFFFSVLSTGYRPFIMPTFQYVSHLHFYFFIVTILVFHRFMSSKGGRHRVFSKTIVIGICLLACSQMYGAFFQREQVRGGFGFFQFGLNANDRIRHESVMALVKKIPVGDKASATKMLNAQISSRADAYTMVGGVYDADWMLVEVPNINWERPGFRDLVVREDFGVVEIRAPFVLLKRHYDKSQNDRLYQMLGG